MTRDELNEKIEAEKPKAINDLIDICNDLCIPDDQVISRWRKSLTREEIKALGRWVDLLYFEKVKEEKISKSCPVCDNAKYKADLSVPRKLIDEARKERKKKNERTGI